MLRFTDVEYEVITENAKNAKRPLAEYIRLQALNKKVTAKYEIVADVPELKKLITELGVERRIVIGTNSELFYHAINI